MQDADGSDQGGAPRRVFKGSDPCHSSQTEEYGRRHSRRHPGRRSERTTYFFQKQLQGYVFAYVPCLRLSDVRDRIMMCLRFAGFVVVDVDGHPHKFEHLKLLSDVIAKEVNVLKIDAPHPSGRGWHRTDSEICTENLGESFAQDISSGAKYILEETWVKASDPHLDAKVWPHAHPHGTGSLWSEPGAGGTRQFIRNRATLIQSWFRRSARRA